MANMPLRYFDEMYEDPDPWGYETSWYEQRKYALTLASLSEPRYRRAFEPGCSIGVLTEMLASRCDLLVAGDFHAGVVEVARRRTAPRSNVEVRQLDVPRQWPSGSFDLIVLSEVAYYLDDPAHRALMDQAVGSLEGGGTVILVHWRGPTNYPQTGDRVHEQWLDDDRLDSVSSHRERDFRIDTLRRIR